MSRSIGSPIPDCDARSTMAGARRGSISGLAQQRGQAHTLSNGEEVDFGAGYLANYHKALPHDTFGRVIDSAYGMMIQALASGDGGAIETLPFGENRSGAGTELDPTRYAEPSADKNGRPLGYRKMTSPLTGHVYDTQGADAGELAISTAPAVGTHELAAEMAELYAMALLRDTSFADIDATANNEAGTDAEKVVAALASMPFFNGTLETVLQDSRMKLSPATRRRFETRGTITSGKELFRGSTPGSKVGPWASQFLLVGNDTTGFTFENMSNPGGNTPSFPGIASRFEHQDGFLIYGTQIIDQRSVVADEGIDWLTNYAAWLDAQNGVDFGGMDIFKRRRRFMQTPRDVATYVHFDALYQAYLNACLLMLGPISEDAKRAGGFPKDRGLPETRSRTRSAFASFGGPHILALVTEVSTRALKAVWRQKWQYHRRMRPEVLAALLTLQASSPAETRDGNGNIINRDQLHIANDSLRAKLAIMLSGDVTKGGIPQVLLDAVAQHNQAQNGIASPRQKPLPASGDRPALPTLDASKNYLLPMAFPEGSPTHPAYGAGHATVAGACVTALKAFFEMFEEDDCTERKWPLPIYFADFVTGNGGNAGEGGELKPATLGPDEIMSIQGELDKLAMNIANARDMAGVHYYTDYYESIRLGERVTVSILEEQLSMYPEALSMHFTSFDGDDIRITANGDGARVIVSDSDGKPISASSWFQRYGN